MMKRILATAVTVGIGAAAPAFADEDRGVYAGAGVGEYNVKIDDVDDVGPVVDDFDESDTSYKIYAGYRFNPYFALELDYMDLGKPESRVQGFPIQAKSEGWAPYAVGTLPLGMFELFAKAGYMFYDVDVDVGDDLNDFSSSDTGEDFVYGAGVGVNLFERLNVRLEYEEIDIAHTNDSNALWLSGAYRF
jgi:OOP family OmpA-OmpF porin